MLGEKQKTRVTQQVNIIQRFWNLLFSEAEAKMERCKMNFSLLLFFLFKVVTLRQTWPKRRGRTGLLYCVNALWRETGVCSSPAHNGVPCLNQNRSAWLPPHIFSFLIQRLFHLCQSFQPGSLNRRVVSWRWATPAGWSSCTMKIIQSENSPGVTAVRYLTHWCYGKTPHLSCWWFLCVLYWPKELSSSLCFLSCQTVIYIFVVFHIVRHLAPPCFSSSPDRTLAPVRTFRIRDLKGRDVLRNVLNN